MKLLDTLPFDGVGNVLCAFEDGIIGDWSCGKMCFSDLIISHIEFELFQDDVVRSINVSSECVGDRVEFGSVSPQYRWDTVKLNISGLSRFAQCSHTSTHREDIKCKFGGDNDGGVGA